MFLFVHHKNAVKWQAKLPSETESRRGEYYLYTNGKNLTSANVFPHIQQQWEGIIFEDLRQENIHH